MTGGCPRGQLQGVFKIGTEPGGLPKAATSCWGAGGAAPLAGPLPAVPHPAACQGGCGRGQSFGDLALKPKVPSVSRGRCPPRRCPPSPLPCHTPCCQARCPPRPCCQCQLSPLRAAASSPHTRQVLGAAAAGPHLRPRPHGLRFCWPLGRRWINNPVLRVPSPGAVSGRAARWHGGCRGMSERVPRVGQKLRAGLERRRNAVRSTAGGGRGGWREGAVRKGGARSRGKADKERRAGSARGLASLAGSQAPAAATRPARRGHSTLVPCLSCPAPPCPCLAGGWGSPLCRPPAPPEQASCCCLCPRASSTASPHRPQLWQRPCSPPRWLHPIPHGSGVPVGVLSPPGSRSPLGAASCGSLPTAPEQFSCPQRRRDGDGDGQGWLRGVRGRGPGGLADPPAPRSRRGAGGGFPPPDLAAFQPAREGRGRGE